MYKNQKRYQEQMEEVINDLYKIFKKLKKEGIYGVQIDDLDSNRKPVRLMTLPNDFPPIEQKLGQKYSRLSDVLIGFDFKNGVICGFKREDSDED